MLTRNLSVLGRYCHSYLRRILEEVQLHGVESLVLSVLQDQDGMSQDYLCAELLLDKASIAKAAAGLEEKGYLTRKVNDQNRREKLLTLTEKGHALLQQLDTAKKKWENICLQGFTEEEAMQYRQLSERVVQNVVAYHKQKGVK